MKLIIVILMGMVLIGCQQPEEKIATPPQELPTAVDFSMEVIEGSVDLSADVLTLSLSNHTNQELFLDRANHLILEYFNGQDWEAVPSYIEIDDVEMLLSIEPDSTGEWALPLEFYAIEQLGRYRVRQQVYFQEEPDAFFELLAEFEVIEKNNSEILMHTQFPSYALGTDEIILIVQNQTDEEIMTDVHFSVEFFDGEEWLTVPARDEYLAFIDIGVIINPRSSQIFQKNLSLFLVEQPGLYRIRKEIASNDLTAEFILE